MKKWVFLCVTLLGLVGCGRRNPPPLPKGAVEKILMSRTACLGKCPVYTVTLSRDGSAELFARSHLSRQGDFTGKVDGAVFDELCERMDRERFDQFALRYDAAYTDAASCTVTVLRKDGRGNSVYEYGREGPGGLHVIQKAIDEARDGIDWQPMR
ncbi:MAG: DUF6438 domain-containing protein [Luteolibacter sp.]